MSTQAKLAGLSEDIVHFNFASYQKVNINYYQNLIWNEWNGSTKVNTNFSIFILCTIQNPTWYNGFHQNFGYCCYYIIGTTDVKAKLIEYFNLLWNFERLSLWLWEQAYSVFGWAWNYKYFGPKLFIELYPWGWAKMYEVK